MKFWACVVLVMFRVVFSDVPYPDFMFFPEDPQVGDVTQVSRETLASRFKGKSALIVGGTDGIGRGIALTLAEAGASVTIVGRSPAKANQTVRDLTAMARHSGSQQFLAYTVDLFTVRGTLSFTNDVKRSEARFDYIVLTIGVWPDHQEPRTSDGIDKVIAADVLSRFLVIREMLPSLTIGARVLSVLGSTSKYPSDPDVSIMKDLALARKTEYSTMEMLATAGVMGDTWMQCMASYQSARNITLIGTSPGIVRTSLIDQQLSLFPSGLRFLATRLAMSPEESGIIHATILSSPNAAMRSVSYFNVKYQGRQTHPLAYDVDFQQWVWSYLQDAVSRHNDTVLSQIIF